MCRAPRHAHTLDVCTLRAPCPLPGTDQHRVRGDAAAAAEEEEAALNLLKLSKVQPGESVLLARLAAQQQTWGMIYSRTVE